MIFTIDKLIELLEKNKDYILEYDVKVGVNGTEGFITKVKIKLNGDVLHKEEDKDENSREASLI